MTNATAVYGREITTPAARNRRTFPVFRTAVTGVLVLLTSVIGLLLLADIGYVNSGAVLDIMRSPDIRAAFWLSMATSAITTALSVIVAVPCAYALSRFPFRGSLVLDVMIDMLIVIPVLVVGVSLLVFFRTGSLLAASANPAAHVAGMCVAACADFFVYQKAGIVLAQFLCSVPFAVRVIKSTFDSTDPRTEHVALTLGCTRFSAFWRVTLPLAKSGIIAGAVLAWARAFGLFGPISVVAGAVRQRTEVLSTSVFLEISVGKLETALAISLLMAAVAFLVLVLMRVFSGGDLFGAGAQQ